jgi:UDP-N-acetylglucosamine 2-epimerase (non-hydrolysing)
MALTRSGLRRKPLRQEPLLGESAPWRRPLPPVGKRDALVLERRNQTLDPGVVHWIDVRASEERDLGAGLGDTNVEGVSKREPLWGDRDHPNLEGRGDGERRIGRATVHDDYLLGRMRLPQRTGEQAPDVSLLVEAADYERHGRQAAVRIPAPTLGRMEAAPAPRSRYSAGTMRIAYVVGARPNFVKMAPVVADLRRRVPEGQHTLIHTGQHYDRLMSDIFLEELGVPAPDHMLNVGSASHAVQTARVMERIEPVLEAERPDLLIAPGDVNSTLAATLVAVKLGIPVAHLESGLRSFDRTMPEEINRIVADEFSEYLFLHSEEAVENLLAEGIAEERMHFVGNTMIDSLVIMEERFRNADTASAMGLEAGNYLLVTLHRPALVDGPLLADVMARLDDVGRELPILFPVHPRTRKTMEHLGLHPGPAVHLTEPVSYLEFLSLEAEAHAVLTDSGGVQEETTYLGVPCFTLRDNTERPVTVRAGTNTLLGLDPKRIDDILPALTRPKAVTKPPPLWDGKAAERVGETICSVTACLPGSADRYRG